ncbi:hypothetical protein [Novosphingobium sp.]|uniref:hypothetical protein n=1 Tax=Novosphingobium sp. TaxID=1874826 RepID=UPI0025FB6B9D|nr:hypothetical protein [Novosphingobium sp.]
MVIETFARVLCSSAVCALLAAPALAAEPVPAILIDTATIKAHPLPDYSYAGYGFGVADIPEARGTVLNVTDFGVVPDDGLDDSQAVLKALAKANAVKGQVTLRFPAGRIQITEILRITRSDIVIEGAGSGPGGTELYFPRPLKLIDQSPDQDEIRTYNVEEKKFQIEPEHNIHYLFSEYSWSGGFILVGPEGSRPASYLGRMDKRDPVLTDAVAGKQFGKTLTVADPRKLKTGQIVQLQWFSTDGEKSPIIASIYGKTDMPIGSRHWTQTNRATVAQSTRIMKIRGKVVTLGDPLLHDIRADQPAVIADWQHLTNVGIQNLHFTFPDAPAFGHHLEQGYNGIYFTGVFDGWMRNMVFDNADSGILTDNAASLTIADVRTRGNRKAHYSVHLGSVHNALVKDLTVENPVVHPVTVNTRSTRSVYLRANVMRDAVIDQHSGSNHQNLFDNMTLHISPKKTGDAYAYQLWLSGGAPYWKPGHGLYNTQWNTALVIDGSVPVDAEVDLTSGLEGTSAAIIGLHGNRKVKISYRPDAYTDATNQALTAVPSLYEYQLARRRAGK